MAKVMFGVFEKGVVVAVAEEPQWLASIAKVSTMRSIKRISRGQAIYAFKRGAPFSHSPKAMEWHRDTINLEDISEAEFEEMGDAHYTQ